jgi:predicted Zn finger-like uncharacterized protein
MSLVTCCPACAATFKVVEDQLRVSDGWVRCVRCSEVFDATRDLRDAPDSDSDSEPAAAPQPTLQHWPDPDSLSLQGDGREAAADAPAALPQLFSEIDLSLNAPSLLPERVIEPARGMAAAQPADDFGPALLQEAVADDPASVRAVGIDVATDLAEGCLRAGAPGLQFFTQNRSTATLAMWRRLRG